MNVFFPLSSPSLMLIPFQPLLSIRRSCQLLLHIAIELSLTASTTSSQYHTPCHIFFPAGRQHLVWRLDAIPALRRLYQRTFVFKQKSAQPLPFRHVRFYRRRPRHEERKCPQYPQLSKFWNMPSHLKPLTILGIRT